METTNIIGLENTLIKQLIANHPIVCTPLTDNKTYQQWVDADDAVKEIKNQTGSKKKEIIKAIAVSLNRIPDDYLDIFKNSVSRAKKSLGLNAIRQQTARKAAIVINIEQITLFIEQTTEQIRLSIAQQAYNLLSPASRKLVKVSK